MRFLPFVGLLLLATPGVLFLASPDRDAESSQPLPPSRSNPLASEARTAAVALPGPDRALVQPGPDPAPPPPLVATLAPDFLNQLVGTREFLVPLADRSTLPLTIAHTETDPDGIVRAVEGTLTDPAPGRFLFRRQPPGTLPGPFAGVVFFPSLDYGYRLESAGTQPVLVPRHVDALACVDYHAPAEPDPQEIPDDHPTSIPIPAYQRGVIPLQSLPTAAGVLYLDFDGEDGPHEGWGDFDAASFNFTNTKIKDIWERVAEDFASFNLNVTTDLHVYLDATETSRQRCIVTSTTTASPGSGGIAYVGSFNWSGDTPCWAYLSGTKDCAEVISHELGHTLTLGHDGRTTPAESYYGGHGLGDTAWAPIMGVGYSRNLTQWSKGEYLNANNTQDDLLRITTNNNAVSYRLDDHAATHAAATPLGFLPSGAIKDEGLIETNGDLDAFLFTTTTGGALAIHIDPVAFGPNLDLRAELYDATNTLLESSNPLQALDANLTATVPAGAYTVRITNTGKGDPLGSGYSAYATLGQYTLTGTVPSPVLPDFFEIAENSPFAAAVGAVAARKSHGANPLTWAIASGNDLGAFQINPLTGQLTVDDPAILDVESLSPGWNDPPVFELVVALTDTMDSNLNESIRVLITVLDVNERPTVDDASLTILEHTLPGRTLLTLNSSDPDEFDVVSFAITGGDPASRFAIDPAGRLSPATDLAFATQSSYTLTITATDSGTPGLTATATVAISLIDTVEGHLPGQVEHTFFRNITGNQLTSLTSDPDFPNCPDDLDFRPEVHARDDGDNYGRVVRAFLIPPLTGSYTFWIAGDDYCRLDLSSDDDPAHATTIATIAGWTDYQQWDKYGSQKSASIPLVAGQAYYLEARQKEGGGGDHLSLAWEVKDASNNTLRAQEPIPGLFLAPHSMNYCPRLTIASRSLRRDAVAGTLVHDFDVFDLNPADSHTFSLTSGDPAGKFAIDPLTGRVTVADNTALAASYSLGIRVTDNGTPALSANTTLLLTLLSETAITATGPLVEFWDGLAGSSLATLTSSPLFPDRPQRLLQVTNLDSGENNGNGYGARLRAILTPAATGSYTFHIASDDNGLLLLSSDNNPGNVTPICGVSDWTGYREWNKFPAEQKSAPVTLIAGQPYFIEARVKESGGGDHVEVGWTGPGIGAITIIASSFLAPYDSNVAPGLTPLNPVVDLPANPAPGTTVASFTASDSPFETITFAILAGNDDGAFSINPQSGLLTVANPAALHSGPHLLTIGAQDSGHGGHFPLRTTATTVTLYLDDTDHDLLPDSWEIVQFGNLAQTGAGDFDLDLVTNRGEFLFGSSATDPFSFPRPEATGASTATTARFRFKLRNDVPRTAFALYLSSDLLSWTPLTPAEFTIVSSLPDGASHLLLTVELPFAGSHCFFRLGVDH